MLVLGFGFDLWFLLLISFFLPSFLTFLGFFSHFGEGGFGRVEKGEISLINRATTPDPCNQSIISSIIPFLSSPPSPPLSFPPPPLPLFIDPPQLTPPLLPPAV